jgi:hypothetical protein
MVVYAIVLFVVGVSLILTAVLRYRKGVLAAWSLRRGLANDLTKTGRVLFTAGMVLLCLTACMCGFIVGLKQ